MSAPGIPRRSFVDRHGWAPYALMVVTALCFAGNHVVGRAAGPVLPAFALVFWRSLVALLLILPFVAPSLRRSWPLLKAGWLPLLGMALLQVVIGQSALFLGLQTTTAINAGLINATLPALIVGLAALILRERVTLLQWLGLAVASIGSLVIITRGDPEVLLGLHFVVGDLWIQLAFIVWAFYAVVVRLLPKDLDSFVAFFAFTAMALPFQAILFAIETAVSERHAIPGWGAIAAIGYTALFGSVVALVCLNVAISRLGTARAGQGFNLVPIFTVVFAVTLLGERFELFHLAGIALAFCGIVLAARRPR